MTLLRDERLTSPDLEFNTQGAGESGPREVTSGEHASSFEDFTFPPSQRGAIAELMRGLRVAELRELAIDVLDGALTAYEGGDLEALREDIESWLETAEVMGSSRHRMDSILAAREKGRAKFGSAQGRVRQERRKVRRETR